LSVSIKYQDTFEHPVLSGKSQLVELNDYGEISKIKNQGFTLYEASTLLEIFNFQKDSLENNNL
jgi:hypothetical protein